MDLLKIRYASSRADTLRATPVLKLCLAASLALGIGLHGHYVSNASKNAFDAVVSSPVVQHTLEGVAQSSTLKTLSQAQAGISAALKPVLVAKSENATREVELESGQTFADLLSDAGVADADAMAAMTALSKVYNLRKLHAGQGFTLSFQRSDKQELFTGAVFQPEATKEISIARTAQGTFAAEINLIPVERHRLAARGEINSSLYEVGNRANVPHAIMACLLYTSPSPRD